MSNFVVDSYRFAAAEDLCQLLTSNYAMVGYSNTRERVGVKLQSGSTWIGKTIDAVKFFLMWGDDGTGTVYARVYRDGTTDPIITFGSKAIQTINKAASENSYACGVCNWEEVTFTGGGSYTLLENDIICVVNDNGAGAPSLFTEPYFDAVPNGLLQMRYSSDSWSEATGESLKMCIEEA